MPTDRRPNILWYCTDAQRFDTIHALGNAHIRTPNLDRLVAGGAAFTRTYAQNTMCTPSRVSFMTGRYPASHHVYRNGNAGLPKTEVLVTRTLAEAGYDCGLIGKLHMSSSKRGEKRPDDGYRLFLWSNMPNPDVPEADRQNAYHAWLREKGIDPYEIFGKRTAFVGPGLPEELQQTRWATEMAIRFIGERRDRPWLLSLNPFCPHPPYEPPQAFLAHYDPSIMPPPVFRESDLDRQAAFLGIRHQNIHARNPLLDEPDEGPDSNDADFHAARTYKPPKRFNGRLMKCGYYALIEMIDHHFGQLIDYLRDCGQLERTLVIFHSDHGELLGDHGLVFKGARFFEGAVHVPLLLHWPDRIPGGLVSDALTELVDIAPTLLEAAGLAIPPAIQGRSLLPIADRRTDPNSHKQHVVCDFYDSVGYSQVDDPTQATMTFDGRYKMVIYHRHNLGELFDLAEDPNEFDDLWSRPEYQSLKLAVIQRHVDAVMATISPGPPRVTQY